MPQNINKEVRAMKKRSVRELRKQYADVFGESTNASNKSWLIKRITWRIQSNIEGDISERARNRAAEIANDSDLRMSPPKATPNEPVEPSRTKTSTLSMPVDDRLPLPGTKLVRKYKKQTYEATVLASGFEYDGEIYKSLTAVAKAITGQHCSGFAFFRLGEAK